MITRSNQATIIQFMKRTPERVVSGDFPSTWTDEMIEYCCHIIAQRTMNKEVAKIRQDELKAIQRKEKVKLLVTVANWIRKHAEKVPYLTQSMEHKLTTEERKLHNRRYYEANKERINQRNKEYRERNKDYCKAYDKARRKRNYNYFNIASHGPHGLPVRCIETGEIFDNGAEASRSMGLHANAVNHSIHRGYRAGGYYWEYLGEQVGSPKFNKKDYQKKYGSQICEYKGEDLTLKALIRRFQRAGVEHPAIEAKKYLKK